MRKLLTSIILALSIFWLVGNAFSAENTICDQKQDPFCLETNTTSDTKKISWTKDLPTLITDGIIYLLWFLFFVSVIYWIYWAWQIFSALNEDSKVKKWKTIIIRAAIWMVVIFSAYMITDFVINQFLFSKVDNTIETK